MLINLTMQMLWITYSPINEPAAQFYGVSTSQIGWLAMSFMVTYLFLSFPASWVIDRYGFRTAVGIGSVLMGAFAIVRE
jgi:MFS family permease